MTDETKKEADAADATAPKAEEPVSADSATPTADETKKEEENDTAAAAAKTAPPEEEKEEDDENAKKSIASLVERLRFFFSNANLRQDKWMRYQLDQNGCVTLDSLLRFQTIKKISTDKALLAKAAQEESLKELIVYSEERGEIRRVVPFDWRKMGDGSHLSLYVKNVPVTKEPNEEENKSDDAAVEKKEEDGKKEGDADVQMKDGEEKPEKKEQEEEVDAMKKEGESKDGKEDDKMVEDKKDDKTKKENVKPFRPRYAVNRDEIKALFEPYGRVGIVNLRFGRKGSDGKLYYGPDQRQPRGRGHRRDGQSFGEILPMGVAIVEFETEEGHERACKDLLPRDGENDPATALEIKGNKLTVEKMRPPRVFHNGDRDNSSARKNNKRKHDNNDDNGKENNSNEEAPAHEEDNKFEPVTLEWSKGCVISISGLSTTTCDRESIREAVSDILGVSTDVKTSGMYVDYTRGASSGKLRLKESKPTEMKELVEKLNNGSVKIADEAVGEAKVLEGDEEEAYWKDFIGFLNNRKKMRDEEKRQNKRQRMGHGRHGRGGRRGGRGGGRGYMRGSRR
mmetsp:Transcript_42444/g.72445  ORF Transcript_42444/g.72445 Transcript_42444/m.72445 type:complete len:568 (+) Transcript_42444:115-1818(+)